MSKKKKTRQVTTKVIVGVIIVVVLILAGVLLGNKPTTSKSSTATPSNNTAMMKQDASYADWTLFRNGYALPIPPDWKNTSDTGGRAVLEPGTKIGSIKDVAVTIVSDAKANGKRFTSQSEFDQWYAVTGKVQGTIQKNANTEVDGQKAVTLFDTTKGETQWVSITWTRRDGRNVYISATGNGAYTQTEADALAYMSSNFKFKAPPMTEEEIDKSKGL